jgi:hydroxymethylbilane synthase
MRAVEGSCQVPVAAYAVRVGGEMWLRAMLAEPDGTRMRRRELKLTWPATAAEAARAGVELGAELKSA